MNSSSISDLSEASISPDVLRLWVARILTNEKYWERLLSREERTDRQFILAWVARLFCIAHETSVTDPSVLQTHLQAARNKLEASPPPCEGIIFHNLDLLQRFVRLQPLERELLAFRVYVREEWRLASLISLVVQNDDSWSESQLHGILAAPIGLAPEQMQSLLSMDSTLIQTGLVRFSGALEPNLLMKLPLLRRLPDALLSRFMDEARLISLFAQLAPLPTLNVDDYPHITEERNLLLRYFEGVLRTRTIGANILIHGIPGVGKTEFVRTIAQAMNVRLYEIPAFAKESGESLPPAERLDLLKLNQALFSHSEKVLLLFDEIEDAFQPAPKPFRKDNPVAHNKAWLNQLLERNATPTLWVSNQIDHLDRALLRRFDMVLNMRTPPESVRRRALEQHYQKLPASPEWLAHAARDTDLTPAFHARSARVLELAGIDDEKTLIASEGVLRRHFKQAYGCKSTLSPGVSNLIYDPSMINADMDIDMLLTGMERSGRGRLLFHGSPGTGKTALAHHLAQRLDKPLIERRASDLISMWLGETEKLIRAAFEQAREENAILLLDEADSFLASREQAHRSWEITQVNELLTQIESHSGVLICCTNNLRHMDAAAMRRFPLKLKFGWLTPKQRIDLFWRYLPDSPNTAAITELVTQRLDGLAQLALGDYAACGLAAETLGQPISVEWLLDALAAEHALKPGGQTRRIGFTS